MTQQCYINDILKPYIKKWQNEGYFFVLKKNNDFGHNTQTINNPVYQFKEQHGIQQYTNPIRSFNLAIIETCWFTPKGWIKKQFYFDNEMLKQLILEKWDHLNYESINKIMESMPQQLKDVIRLKSQMTAY